MKEKKNNKKDEIKVEIVFREADPNHAIADKEWLQNKIAEMYSAWTREVENNKQSNPENK